MENQLEERLEDEMKAGIVYCRWIVGLRVSQNEGTCLGTYKIRSVDLCGLDRGPLIHSSHVFFSKWWVVLPLKALWGYRGFSSAVSLQSPKVS